MICSICKENAMHETSTGFCQHKFCQLCLEYWYVKCFFLGNILSCPRCGSFPATHLLEEQSLPEIWFKKIIDIYKQKHWDSSEIIPDIYICEPLNAYEVLCRNNFLIYYNGIREPYDAEREGDPPEDNYSININPLLERGSPPPSSYNISSVPPPAPSIPPPRLPPLPPPPPPPVPQPASSTSPTRRYRARRSRRTRAFYSPPPPRVEPVFSSAAQSLVPIPPSILNTDSPQAPIEVPIPPPIPDSPSSAPPRERALGIDYADEYDDEYDYADFAGYLDWLDAELIEVEGVGVRGGDDQQHPDF